MVVDGTLQGDVVDVGMFDDDVEEDDTVDLNCRAMEVEDEEEDDEEEVEEEDFLSCRPRLSFSLFVDDSSPGIIFDEGDEAEEEEEEEEEPTTSLMTRCCCSSSSPSSSRSSSRSS